MYFLILEDIILFEHVTVKPPAKLSVFHKQVLLAPTVIYKHNFSSRQYIIWNNKNLIVKNKSLFLKTWFQELDLIGESIVK